MKNAALQQKYLVYLITEGKATPQIFPAYKKEILRKISLAVDAKIDLVQIREKNIPARLVFELASEAARIAVNAPTRILVNDRADIAVAARTDGVHLTANSIPADVIRANFPKGFIIGVSAHSFETAEDARKMGADFATMSPVFESPGKGNPIGPDVLREVCEATKPFPIIALGGIDETNWRDALASGAAGFAAIRFLNEWVVNGKWKTESGKWQMLNGKWQMVNDKW